MLKKQTYRVRLIREIMNRETCAVAKEEKFVTVEAEGGSLAFIAAKEAAGRAECWSPISLEIIQPAAAGEKRPDGNA